MVDSIDPSQQEGLSVRSMDFLSKVCMISPGLLFELDFLQLPSHSPESCIFRMIGDSKLPISVSVRINGVCAL